MNGTVLVLDAMGVIYESGDDVAELLVPFVIENGGLSDAVEIERLYTLASLGEIEAADFWNAVGVSPTLEEAYLASHRLNEGLEAFLNALPSSIEYLWCLSNDLGEWSRTLRDRHELTQHFAGFVISSEVHSRKPEKEIYLELLSQAQSEPAECLFVDDRKKNLDAARLLGFQTVGFGKSVAVKPEHPWVESFAQLSDYMQ